MMKLLVALYFLSNLLASGFSVLEVEGTAVVKSYGSGPARKLVAGQRVKGQSILKTGKLAYLKIKLANGSEVSLGSSSTLLVHIPVKEKSVQSQLLELESGRLSALVPYDKNKQLMISTDFGSFFAESGGHFLLVHNRENKVSSNVVFKGSIRLNTISKRKISTGKSIVSSRGEVEVERDDENEVHVITKTVSKSISKGWVLREIAGMDDGIDLWPGQLASTAPNFKKVIGPVNLSKVQFNALFRNKKLRLAERSSMKKEDLSLEDKDLALKDIKTKFQPEGFFNSSEDWYIPKAGGVLDLETSLYLPPSKESSFDIKNKTYVPGEIGYIDYYTGDYIPPKGLMIDPKKGFIIRRFRAKNKAKKRAIVRVLGKKRSELNSQMQSSFLLDKKAVGKDSSSYHLSYPERMTKNVLSVEVGHLSESIEMKDNTISSPQKFEKSGYKSLILNWDHNSNSRWQPLSYVGLKVIDYGSGNSINGYSTGASGLIMMGIGFRYNVSLNLNLKFILGFDQSHFPDHITTSGVVSNELTKFTIPYFKTSGEYVFYRRKRWSFLTDSGIRYSLSKENGSSVVKSALGIHVNVGARYFINDKFSLDGRLRFESISHSLEGTNFTSKVSHKQLGPLVRGQFYF